ncbi:ABC transporter permease [uncultured Rikenella sp.]|uniref:ABC transporter permease n=1 Tax=uncultured Rikenella sp. TaxID=368003 RepID=UPI0026394133|nr:ABC transporter permease [uncultured Rikenella sp.]
MSKIALIIQREFNQRVRKRSFIIMTILMPILMAGLMIVPVLIAQYGSSPSAAREIVVVDSSGVVAPALRDEQGLAFTATAMTYDSARMAPQYSGAFGFLVVGPQVVGNPSELTLYTRESSTLAIENNIREQVRRAVYQKRIEQANVPGLDSILERLQVYPVLTTYRLDARAGGEGAARESSSAISMGVSYALGFIIYLFIFIYGAAIMQGVIEEKSNRIVEVIVSSVKPFQLMMGKIIGMALVALTQFAVWVVLIGGTMLAIQHFALGCADAMPAELTTAVKSLDGIFLLKMAGAFLLFFTGGYLLYASMYAAVGSAVENVQDTQQLQLPITIPLFLAVVVMMNVMHDPTNTVAFWFSIIPFTSPIIMIARIPFGVPAWEVALSAVLLYATFLLIVSLAAKIYLTGIFMYGKKPTLGEMLRWIRYKG